MIFDDFESMEFIHRDEQGFVYVLCWKQGSKQIPFYVGQTQAIWGRMNDYHWGEFQASTDFRINQAIRYLSDRDLRVVARYKRVPGKRAAWAKKESEIVLTLEADGWLLLNSKLQLSRIERSLRNTKSRKLC